MGGALDLLAVFVGAGMEEHVFAEHALATCNGIAGEGGVGVPEVRARVHVIDRSR